jgi:hypothetical protein
LTGKNLPEQSNAGTTLAEALYIGSNGGGSAHAGGGRRSARPITAIVTAVDPNVTIPRRGLTFLGIPDWILGMMGNAFNEVMAYPKIDLPMYAQLKDISIGLFLPNINLIPSDSITLIETNQRFIEACMVGLNHEFARKLPWRGYPTDQRGSYFRQLWDVGSSAQDGRRRSGAQE